MSHSNSKGFGFSVGVIVVIGAIVLGINAKMQSVVGGGANEDMSKAAIAKRIAPIGEVNTGAPIVAKVAAPEASHKTRTGEEVFNTVCTACHSAGVMGAPIIGHKDLWAPRIKKGIATLLNHAEHGFKNMPPRGTCGDCSNEELKNAIEYMISKSK